MSSPTQPSLEGAKAQAKAQMSQLGQKHETERDKFRTAIKTHETHINSLKQSFEEGQQSIMLDFETALADSNIDRQKIELKLQEERQRVVDLTNELEKMKTNKLTVELASEKINHGLTKIALDKSKTELEEAKIWIAAFKQEFEAAEQNVRGLQLKCADLEQVKTDMAKLSTELDTVNKRKDHVEAELELSKRKSADLQKRFNAAEQRQEADLQAATRRATCAEDELKTFKSFLKRMNDDMSSLVSSSKQQPIATQPTSSAHAPIGYDSVEQRESTPQTNDSLASPPSPESQANHEANHAVSDKESNLLPCKSVLDEIMDAKYWESNRYFLKDVDSLTLASRDAKLGRFNLGTMKEKLSSGAYTSVTSLKADFNLMIADAKSLNPPGNHVRIAAEQLLKIFDQAIFSLPVSSHEPQEIAGSAQDANSKKRKAGPDTLDTSQNGPAKKRQSLAPTEQGTDLVEPAIPGTRASSTPASIVSSQSKDAAEGPEQSEADQVKRQIKTGSRLDIDATLSTVAQLVSFAKSPSTITGHWKSLVPDEYWLTAHALPSTVQDHIYNLVHDQHCSDMIILRLLPAAGADKPEFNRILDYFIQKERYATVSHTGIDDVQGIYLIPASKAAHYPSIFPTLDPDLVPHNPKIEDVLFMAIIFDVAEDKQRQVRDAWDGRMKAIQNHDEGSLVSMSDALLGSPLDTFGEWRRIVSSSKRFRNGLNVLPVSKEILRPELQACGKNILHLSYPTSHPSSRPIVNGVQTPGLIFVLGRLLNLASSGSNGLLVIDLEKTDRSLWLLRHIREKDSQRFGRKISLVRSKFPGSLAEWENTFTVELAEKIFYDRTRTAFKLERCRLPN